MKQPELGLKIVALRKKKDLTQEELVEKCNINVRTLQRIESGEVNPRSFTIRAIFNALDYDINNNSVSAEQKIKDKIEHSIQKFYKQLKNINAMKNSTNFFYNYFLATGIVWFFCALCIVIFNLNFQMKEILLTIIVPLAFSIFRQFTTNETVKMANQKED